MEKAAQKAQVSIVISAQRNAAQRHTRGGVKQCWQAAHALFKNKSKKCPLKCQWCFRQCWLGRGVRITVINGPGVGGIASVWLLCCCCYPWFKPPPFFFLPISSVYVRERVRGRGTDEEHDTDRDGETRRDPGYTVSELLQLISFHIIECIWRQRDLVRWIGAPLLISNSDLPSRSCLKNAGNVVSILKISAYHFSLQFKIKGYTLPLLTQQNEVIVHVVITAG